MVLILGYSKLLFLLFKGYGESFPEFKEAWSSRMHLSAGTKYFLVYYAIISPTLIVVNNTEQQMKAILQPTSTLLECSGTGGAFNKKAAHVPLVSDTSQ